MPASDAQSFSQAAAGDPGVLAFPASVAQQMFWYLELLQGTVTAFNVPLRFSLTGPLDVCLFERALNAVVERHESLRTHFGEDDGELLQIVVPAIKLCLPVIDISHFPEDRMKEEADRLGSIEAHRPFDLSKGPLLRAELLRLGKDKHVFHFTVHHALFDGMSMAIFGRELAEFYQAFFENRRPRLEPLAIQYGDYSVWQKEFLAGPKVKAQLEYWKNQLKGMKEVALPTDFPRPAVKSWKGDITSVLLPKALSEKLQSIAAGKGATLFHVHLAAFMMLLRRYSGNHDIAVGAPVAGRSGGDLEPIIGVFINTLILRADLSGNPTFFEFLAKIRAMSLEALENQELPFEHLVHELRPERDPGRNPLFQINFNHHRSFTGTEHFGGVSLTTIPSRSPGAIFDLHIFFVERDEGWRASLDFCTDLFTRESADRMLGHVRTLLEDIAAHPDKHIEDFEILTGEEKIRLTGGNEDKALILDDLLRLVPVGIPGELYIRNDSPDPESGRKPVIDHPEFGELVRTGDVCRVTVDGGIEFISHDRKAPDDASHPAAETKTREANVSNPVECSTISRLTAIWQELLGVSKIDPDDDFFALGGHSLMTLRMFSRIHREFGKSLPLATLLEYPTIASLALQITPDEKAAAVPTAQSHHPVAKPLPENEPPSRGKVITLNEGRGATPLFCIHGGDGGVIFYRELAALLPAEIPFHAIESLELAKSGGIERRSIEETAACYLEDILRVQPQGPYRLAGYSFGGVVAHEIACLLTGMGHKVAFLGMFDTHNPAAPSRRYGITERLSVFWGQHEHLPLATRIGLLKSRIKDGARTNRRVRDELKSARSSGPAAAYSDMRRIQVREENWRAMQAYTPRPFAGRITLFKTNHVNDKFERPDDYGWAAVALEGLNIIPVEGEHLALFSAENVGNLAGLLKTALDESGGATR